MSGKLTRLHFDRIDATRIVWIRAFKRGRHIGKRAAAAHALRGLLSTRAAGDDGKKSGLVAQPASRDHAPDGFDAAGFLHDAGKLVDVWTIDAGTRHWRDRVARAVTAGVDIVTTNTPRQIAAAFRDPERRRAAT